MIVLKKNIKNNLKIFISTILILNIFSINTFSHSGRTDDSGGHKDNNNVSGLGSYHFHHGMEAHLHNSDGTCSYAINKTQPESLSIFEYLDSIKNNKTNKVNIAYSESYNKGYSDGLNGNSYKNETLEYIYDKKGYNQGYNNGKDILKKEIKNYEIIAIEDANNFKEPKEYFEIKNDAIWKKYLSVYNMRKNEILDEKKRIRI